MSLQFYEHLVSVIRTMRSPTPMPLAALRRGSAVARLLGMRVRIPAVAWMSVLGVLCCQVEASASG